MKSKEHPVTIHSSSNFFIQEQQTYAAMRRYLGDLSKCGFLIRGEEVEAPMCLRGHEGLAVADRVWQRANQ